MTQGQIQQAVVNALEDLKAKDILTIPLAGKTDIADSMIIASGTSTRHIRALAHNVQKSLQELHLDSGRVEGDGQSEWVLLDLDSVIVHLFIPQARAYYDLEQLWGGVRPGSQP